MHRISLTEVAHNIVRGQLSSGQLAIDATLGNGNDCVFLAQCVGSTGHVYGFDVQQQAIYMSQQRLTEFGILAEVSLIHASHAHMVEHIPVKLQGQIQAIMFNLGYLPGSDKTVITQSDSTLQAVNAACQLLAGQGVLTVTAYPGHAGGLEETRKLEQWFQQLDLACYQSEIIFSHHHQQSAPRLFVIRKLV